MAGGRRLDKVLASVFSEVSRVRLVRAVAAGAVRVDGEVCARPARKVAARCEVAVAAEALAAPPSDGAECAPEAMELAVVYEDEWVLVLNKPPHVVTHPGHGNRFGTLQAGILSHHEAAAGLVRGGIVHRLDKGTSGLLAVAKTAAAQAHLTAQFKAREIGREYLALVHGEPPATGVIDKPLRRHRFDAVRMAVAVGGREAVTRFVCERRWRGFALLRCRLLTGRTHQIRVHLEHCGFPVAGDPVYRRRAAPLPFVASRQMLHAERLRLRHPASEDVREWRVGPPGDMADALNFFENGVG